MAGGISFQTQRAINELDREGMPVPPEADILRNPNEYVRPPGVQTMSPDQVAKLQELQLRRAAELKALRAGTVRK
jgi:hypothetical protein